jgi:hypothetical protein
VQPVVLWGGQFWLSRMGLRPTEWDENVGG